MLSANYVRFATSAGGANVYVLPINPYNVSGFEPAHTDYLARHVPIDGKSRFTKTREDTLEKAMYFRYRSDQTALATMYTTLKSYEGTTKYFKDGVIGAFTDWTAMRIVSVERDVLQRYHDEKMTFSLIVRMKRV